ncbi:mucin-16 [Struthio camelus]|uniref:mucin-16 n=1 Tax=Struthio camelus TaxID=8801 RepID=UPI003603E61B
MSMEGSKSTAVDTTTPTTESKTLTTASRIGNTASTTPSSSSAATTTPHRITASPTQTTVPALERFTINFTITNLPYNSDLAIPHSAKLNTTQRVMATLLKQLLKEASIGPAFLGCEPAAFRPVRQGDNTGVDAVCTYRHDSSAPPLDRVGLYHQVSNKTKGITQLGPYSLDKDSLYVNEYTEPPLLPSEYLQELVVVGERQPGQLQLQPPPWNGSPSTSPSPTTVPALERFTINFTITNLPYNSDLAIPHSAKLNTTQSVMATLLKQLLKEASIGPAFLGCEPAAFRPVRQGDNTGVDAVCTYRHDSSAPPLDRVGLYHQVSNKTKGITQLGPYSLDKDSLYVNEYTEPPLLPSEYLQELVVVGERAFACSTGPAGRRAALAMAHSDVALLSVAARPTTTPATALERFTLNFTLTSLAHTQDLATPHSREFNETQKALTSLLDPILGNSSLGPAYAACEVTAFRPEARGSGSVVDAVCTYRHDSSAPPLDRVGLYHQVSNKTKGITQLGPYSLDKDSLYVNGYNEQPVLPCSRGPRLVMPGGSGEHADLPPREQRQEGARAGARPWRFSTQSLHALALAPFHSASVLLAAASPTQTTVPALERFTINFTITNLPYNSDLAIPHSAKLNTTQRVMATLLKQLLKEASIGPAFLGCEPAAFRPVRQGDNTGVDAVCTYRHDSSAPPLDRVGLYHQVSNKTKGITQLGPYSLDKDSLYVNGKHLSSGKPFCPTPASLSHAWTGIMQSVGPRCNRASVHRAPAAAKRAALAMAHSDVALLSVAARPTTTPATALERFTLNFTLTSLAHTQDLATPHSREFNETQKALTSLLDPILGNNSLGPAYAACEVTAFRPEARGSGSVVDAVCTYRHDSSAPPLDRVGLYHQVTTNSQSCHVSSSEGKAGVQRPRVSRGSPCLAEAAGGQAASPTQTTVPALERFTINFTITNLPYNSDLAIPHSAKLNTTQRVMATLLKQLLKEASIGPAFLGCEPAAFRPVRQGDNTGVDAVCTYRHDSSAPPLDRVGLYHQVSNKTKGITQLGPYSLDKDSLYVNEYTEPPLLPTARPTTTPATALERFTLNFTLTSLAHTQDLATPHSREFNETQKALTSLLDPILGNSSLGPAYAACEVTAFRLQRTASPAIRGPRLVMPGGSGEHADLPPREQRQEGARAGARPWRFSTQSLHALALAPFHSASVLLAAASPTQTTVPALERFTINFTITNLPYNSDLAIPHSAKLNTTQRVMATLLKQLLKEASIGPAFLGCEPAAFRPVRQGDNTGVDAVCTYRHDSSAPPLDRVGLYHQVSNKTKGITQLGPYSLDKDSLYVNGKHLSSGKPFCPTPASLSHAWTGIMQSVGPRCNRASTPSPRCCQQPGQLQLQPPPWNGSPSTSPSPTTVPALERFTINFTITNLPYNSDLAIPHSAKLNTTQRVMATLLKQLLKEASIGPAFLGCEPAAFRPVRQGDNTGVDAVCTYRHDSSAPPLDRVGLYHQVSNKTKGITQLGPYSLDKDSLYVNGKHLSSGKPFCPTPASLSHAWTGIMQSVGPRCNRASVHRAPAAAKRAALAMAHSDVALLSVAARPTTTPATALERFTLNFTLTSLAHTQDLATPHSREFNETQKALTSLLDPILGNNSLGPAYAACEVTAFRPEARGSGSVVDAVCTYRHDSSAPPLDRVGLYHQVTTNSQSCHVSSSEGKAGVQRPRVSRGSPCLAEAAGGQAASPTQTTVPALERFTINFTITNLPYNSDLAIPHSAKLNTTQRVMATLLKQLLKEASIGPAFLGCEPAAFRPVRQGDNTGVDAVCTYRHDSSAPPLDRVGLYHQVSNKTKGITQLGPYSLDKDSLYVNEYTEPPLLPTARPTTTPATALERFTLNFTLTSLAHTQDLATPHSREFNETQKALTSLLDPILGNSSLGPAYAACEVTAFRPEARGSGSVVDAVCTYRHDSSAPPLDRVGLYHQVTTNSQSCHVSSSEGKAGVQRPRVSRGSPCLAEAAGGQAASPTQTTVPALERFTINFTITNLPYNSDLAIPHSAKLNTTQRVMATLLKQLLKEASIGPAFLGCEPAAFRPVRQGDNTGVDAVCTYRHDSSAPPLDRVGLYHQVSNKTKGITQLGPYSLDKDSLYVNGKHLSSGKPFCPTPASLSHAWTGIMQSVGPRCNRASTPSPRCCQQPGQLQLQPPPWNGSPSTSPSPTTVPALERFTINFTITNLPYNSDLAIPHSAKLNTTQRVMATLLKQLLKEASIGPAFLGCEPAAFRPVRQGDNTGVDAVCTYRHDSSAPPLDRVGLYHQVSNKTKGITQLGPYSLDKDSLYVNEYTEPPLLPTARPTTTPATALERFTLNFTLTSLAHTQDLATPHSREFNETQKALTSLLDPILGNSSLGPAYAACEVTAFRPEARGSGSVVDAVCTYRHDSSAPPLDRVGLYHQVSNKTKGITQLGPYSLDKDSLYVNGYNEQPVLPCSRGPRLVMPGGSGEHADLPPREQRQEGARAGARPWRFSTQSLHALALAPFHSASVLLAAASPTQTTVPALERFTINFTITNLPYNSDLAIPHSAKLNTTQRVMATLLKQLLKEASIGPAFLGCEPAAFRPVRQGDNTGVDAVCTYRHDSSAPPLDRVGLYHQVSNKTKGITQLGPYSLDKDSLYVNEYTEPPLLPTARPTTTPATALERFTLNFTLTSLAHTQDLATPHSREFNETQKALTSLLDPILGNSSLGPAYAACEVTAFRPEARGSGSVVDAVCTYRHDSSAPPLDRVGLYHQVSNKTKGITQLGPYSLDKDSLYVNGYNEQPVLPSASPTQTTVPALERFTINFTITNLPYNSDLAIPHSAKLNTTQRVMATLLKQLLKEASIGPAFLGCEPAAFRPVRQGDNTGVDAVCTYRHDSSAPPLDRVGLYHQVSNKTKGITQLGPYSLDKDSLYVNEYTEPPLLPSEYLQELVVVGERAFACSTGPAGRRAALAMAHSDVALLSVAARPTTTPATALERFTLNFTLTSLAHTQDLATPHSREFNETQKALTSLLDPILGNSSLGPAYAACEVTAFRPEARGSGSVVDAVCTYRHDSSAPPLDRVGLYHQVSNKTKGITQLGPYSLDKDSLYVNGYNEQPVLPCSRGPRLVMPGGSGEHADLPPREQRQEGARAGARPWRFSTQSLHALALAPFHSASVLLAAASPTQTTVPALERFTINFTITNLPYNSDLAIPHSAKLNTTQRVMATLLKQLLKEASIGPAFLGCEPAAFRPVRQGDNTGVDAVCTYRHDSSAPPLDRVGLYHQVSNKTKGITQLGPYSLDKDSLYVNEYTEPPLLPSEYLQELVVVGERAFACSTGPAGRRAALAMAHSDVALLSVAARPTTTPATALERFTLNFTLTSLAHTQDLATPHSREFNETQKALTSLLDPILGNSSLGPAYAACEVTAFRPEARGSGSVVDAVCTYRHDSSAPPLDRVGLYHQVSNKTKGITQLGPYSLDKDSLYVNGYNEQPVLPCSRGPRLVMPGGSGEHADLPPREQRQEGARAGARPWRFSTQSLHALALAPFHSASVLLAAASPTQTTVPALERFTINFTITNLPYNSDLAIPHSAKLNTTQRVMATLLKQLLKEASIGPAFLGCEPAAFRPVRQGDNTGVDAVCTYRHDSSAPPLDRVGLYHQVSNKTKGITQLGPYSLDKDSLYVNGKHLSSGKPFCPTPASLSHAWTGIMQSVGPRCNRASVHRAPAAAKRAALAMAHSDVALLSVAARPTTTPATALERFTLNFTLTSLAHTQDLATPHSREFNETQKALTSLLDPILGNSSLGPAYAACEVTAFRLQRTASPAIRGPRLVMPGGSGEHADLPPREQRQEGARAGARPWRFSTQSLHALALAPFHSASVLLAAASPTQTTVPALERFTINFTITNLPYNSDLAIPHSAKLNTTQRVMATLLKQLLKEASIGPAFLGCEPAAFRPVRQGDNTGVDAVCTYRHDSSAPPLDRVGLYHQVSNKTKGITQLGPYSLDKDSLYVNGKHLSSGKPFCPTPASLSHAWTGIMQSVGPRCNRASVHRAPAAAKRAALAMAHSDVALLSVAARPTTTPATALERFTLNFTLTSLAHTQDLATPHSREFNETQKALTSLLDPILGNSSLGPAYAACEVTAFRLQRTASPAIRGPRLVMPGGSGEHADLPPREQRQEGARAGARPWRFSTQSLHALALAPFHSASVLLAAASPTQTTVPALERFTINFTITNLPYNSDLAIPHSAKLNTTQRVMATLLKQLLKEASIGPAFLGCEPAAFRPVRQGDNTGVDAVCTYRHDSSAPPLDRVGLYHQVSNKTKGITQLGPYSLDKDSLYVNGYNEQPVLPSASPTQTTVPALERFTINFTITNLPYNSDLAIPHSAKLNTTQRVMATLLKQLLKEASIGPAFLGCEPAAFRPVRQGDNTGVDAVCTYRHDSSAPPLDRVGLYHQVSNKTKGITQLGPYSLDKDSLYVNGYNEQPVLPSASPTQTTVPALERFTINFTITNLPYNSDLAIPHSAKLNTTQRVMATLLKQLLKEASIGPAFLGCEPAAFRPVRQGDNTGVDAVCTYRHDSSAPPLDRVGLYHQVSNKTKGITQLGPYSLDKDSLYVNEYSEAYRVPGLIPATAASPATEQFTMNFTITNLPYSSSLRNPNSAKFSATGRVLIALLDQLFKMTSIHSVYTGCKMMAFRATQKSEDTGVDAVCTYKRDPAAPQFDRVRVYHEVSNKTNGITNLGIYKLDQESLYINDYHEAHLLPSASPALPLARTERFTVNFTIINLLYRPELGNPNSKKFNATKNTLTYLLDHMLKNSSINSTYTGCTVVALRSVKNRDDTGVDAVCTYRANTTATKFDRVMVYCELSRMTASCTELGPYRLDAASFYVNGYNEPQHGQSVNQSTQLLSPSIRNFTLNFTITNLQFTADLVMPNSKKFKSTEKVMHYYVDPLLQKSSIGPAYIGCNGMAFRSVKNRDDTRVDAICSYRDEPSDPTFNRVTVYHELSNMTNGITKLGHYNLNSQSLYVNDYNEPYTLSFMKPSTTQSPGPTTEQFTLNFTITNLRFTTDLATPNSAKFNSTEKIMQSYIDRLLQRSSTGPDFTGCKVIAFRSVRNRDNTGVDTICNYGSGSQVPKFDRAKVYQELRSMTSGFTKLGVYNLDNNSLYINGYNGPPERAPLSSTTAPSPTSRHFTLNFTLTNLPYTADLDVPSTYKFISTEKIIKHYLDPLFKRGSISPVYTGCRVMRFRSVKDRDDTGVDAVCSYKNNISIASFDREKVYHELSTMTKGVTKLGHYSLEKNSLYVNGFHLTAITRKPVLTEAPAILGYNFSFRIINENLTNSDSQSPEYKAAVESISNKMNQLYHQSNLQDHFLNCSVTRLRPGSIVVDCKCFFQPEPSINRAAVERAFQDGISHATGLRLGSSYQLQGFSVDSLELAIEATTHRTPLQSEKESFRLNFSITNLHYSPALQDTKSQLSKVNKQKIEKELDVFRTSSLKDYFVGCTVESFGPVLGKAYTSVASICKFTLHPSSRALQREVVYEELKHLTQGFTKLGPSYQLDEHSLGVDGYSPLKTAEQERSELPFWAIILICLFTLLGFILLLLLCFLIVFCLRRKSNLYQVQQSMYGVYFPHLNTRKVH